MLVRVLALLLFVALLSSASAALEWQKIENCRLVADEYGDGDSFHVTTGDKDYIFRLYFVDCAETDDRFPDRVQEQADYFGISHAAALKLGKDATVFTAKVLKNPFTVWTKFQDARGASKQHRFYAVIECGSGDLAGLLVGAGLARIYGVKTTLPNGESAKRYVADLKRREAGAKAMKRGGWGSSPAAESDAEPSTELDVGRPY